MTKTTYPETSSNPDFPAQETATLQNWAEQGTFRKSIDQFGENPAEEFVFYDGPPFANGLPHYGHLLTSYVKDMFARYHTQKGEKCERRFGWDCHGLPAEMGAEKELGVSGRAAIEEFGIAKFNDHCRSSVMKYTNEWQAYIERAARWVDFENDYKTMDTDYMESVLWAFSELHKKGLIYESHRVMPYSWAAQTPLSNFETRMDDSYRDRTDKAVYVGFKLKDVPKALVDLGEYNLTECLINAWTTTPWTLPSNLALAASSEMEYVGYVDKQTGRCEIVARWAGASSTSFMDKYKKDISIETIMIHFTGSELVGLSYEPLFPYFKDEPNAFRVLEGDFIEEGSGTGIVHLAPGFGEDDQRVCAEAGIGMVVPVDEAGCYTDAIFDLGDRSFELKDASTHTKDAIPLSLKGLNVIAQTSGACDDEPYKESQLEKFGLANLRIIQYLKLTGQMIKQEDYVHSYPHCWRTDMPIIYKAMSSWYVEVTKFKDRMVELNQDINWIPEHIKDGQFGKWLEGARDWSISRNRYWGCPIPVWRGSNGGIKVFGSIAELEEFFETEVTDLHKPYVDDLTIEKEGEVWTRVSDVFDCWFESGSMPYAQAHYPFENKESFEANFPADFIVEYVGQTRGWFYTLMVLSTALFDRIPFKNCICHGIILAEDGKKLSKRLKNYPDPNDMFDAYGADAVRWRMVKEPIMQGGNLLISSDGSCIRDVVRLSLKPIWNAYHFFSLYANADGIKAYNLLDLAVSEAEDEEGATAGICCGGAHGVGEHPMSENKLDRYILAKLKVAVNGIEAAMDGYDTPAACKAVDVFFEVLNNWYIRRSRDRFWSAKGTNMDDKQAAYDTLYTVLVTMTKAAAPLLPLMTEEIYTKLTGDESVHLTAFPDVSVIPSDVDLVDAMDKVQQVCAAALSVRDKENVRIRQPLASLTIYGDALGGLLDFADIIQDELNVKDVAISDELAAVATRKLQVMLPVVGKRLPQKMKEIMPAVKQGKWAVTDDGKLEIVGELLEPEEFTLLLESSIEKGAQGTDGQDMLVALDLAITSELEAEGRARDVVRMIQQARKDADLQITDRIQLSVAGADDVKSAVEAFSQYIQDQTLAVGLVVVDAATGDHVTESDLEGLAVSIGFSKAS